MRYVILSDVHSNGDALRTVFDSVDFEEVDKVLFLGDAVGYGAEPNEVVRLLRTLPRPLLGVRGNHDKVAGGLESDEDFNDDALLAIRWTSSALDAVGATFVRELVRGPLEVETGVVICHGSPHDEDDYLFDQEDALLGFAATGASVVFFGHTHVPSLFTWYRRNLDGGRLRGDGGVLQLHRNRRYLINPGSVGQPRDSDPRASYMLFDSDSNSLRWFRLGYDVASAQQKIRRAGLPRSAADRLAMGV